MQQVEPREMRSLCCAIVLLLTVSGCMSVDSVRSGEVSSVPQAAPEKADVPSVRSIETPLVARALFDAASNALVNQDLEQAETLLTELVQTYPSFASAHINLGLVFAMTNRPEDANTMFMHAITLEPDECRAYLLMARVQRDQFQFDAAETSLLACTARNPGYADAYLALGVLRELYTGQLLEARTAYERYQQLATMPDERVAIWIGELNRRIDASHQLAAGEL